MAGIYIHIPFCRQACHYCDFHFSTRLADQQRMVDTICKELAMRQKEVKSSAIETIYFGGGTPSLLTISQVMQFLDVIHKHFDIATHAEITLEANPEDLTEMYAASLLQIGVNRLSIGMQTFDDEKLRWMNRNHTQQRSMEAFQNARMAGFQNISTDLIYALPDADLSRWEDDLAQVISLQPEHVSLYGLTIEPKTVFGKMHEKGQLIELPEDAAAAQYLSALLELKDGGYIQYEVANFGKEDYHSRHNMAYWEGVPYLGVGPGAHSYVAGERSFNIRNNAKYMSGIAQDKPNRTTEKLTKTEQINEYLLTRLRTTKGLSLDDFSSKFQKDILVEKRKELDYLAQQNVLHVSEQNLWLSAQGFLVADDVALQLFY